MLLDPANFHQLGLLWSESRDQVNFSRTDHSDSNALRTPRAPFLS